MRLQSRIRIILLDCDCQLIRKYGWIYTVSELDEVLVSWVKETLLTTNDDKSQFDPIPFSSYFIQLNLKVMSRIKYYGDSYHIWTVHTPKYIAMHTLLFDYV
jgi:hypothetical protein